MQPNASVTISLLHGFEPGEPVGGLAARIVFASDEAGMAEAVQLGEQERIVQLLAVGLVADGMLAIWTWPMIGIISRTASSRRHE